MCSALRRNSCVTHHGIIFFIRGNGGTKTVFLNAERLLKLCSLAFIQSPMLAHTFPRSPLINPPWPSEAHPNHTITAAPPLPKRSVRCGRWGPSWWRTSRRRGPPTCGCCSARISSWPGAPTTDSLGPLITTEQGKSPIMQGGEPDEKNTKKYRKNA